MKKVAIAQYEEEMAEFVIYLLKKAGIDAQKQPIVHSCKNEMSRIMGKEWAVGWNPKWAVVVPSNQQKEAEEILDHIAEYNWYERKLEFIDPTKNIFHQLYGLKTDKKKKK